jgi:MFS family permease
MRRLLAHRSARLYLSGQVMSLFGDSALWLAMGIWIKVLTGSSAAAGLSFFALALGSLCGPLGGMLADKVRRRPLNREPICSSLVCTSLKYRPASDRPPGR